jgi:hypothetical protein
MKTREIMENLIVCGEGPYMIQAFRGNNTFLLNNADGTDLPGGPINGRMLKHYLPPR